MFNSFMFTNVAVINIYFTTLTTPFVLPHIHSSGFPCGLFHHSFLSVCFFISFHAGFILIFFYTCSISTLIPLAIFMYHSIMLMLCNVAKIIHSGTHLMTSHAIFYMYFFQHMSHFVPLLYLYSCLFP